MIYRVLIVDDEPRVADTLALVLESGGYETVVAHSGEAAMGLTLQPDLLLTDLIMPGVDGVELYRRLQQRWPGCKGIVLSGSAEAAARACEPEGIPFLVKPVHPLRLLQAVREILNLPGAATGA